MCVRMKSHNKIGMKKSGKQQQKGVLTGTNREAARSRAQSSCMDCHGLKKEKNAR
jgi:hypothetical protein